MSPSQFCLCYTTLPSHDSAVQMGRTLVEERLAACVNIVPGITSIYRWEKNVRSDLEHILYIKTDEWNYPLLLSRIEKLHPYDIPCLIRLEVKDINPAYADWVQSSLMKSEQ